MGSKANCANQSQRSLGASCRHYPALSAPLERLSHPFPNLGHMFEHYPVGALFTLLGKFAALVGFCAALFGVESLGRFGCHCRTLTAIGLTPTREAKPKLRPAKKGSGRCGRSLPVRAEGRPISAPRRFY